MPINRIDGRTDTNINTISGYPAGNIVHAGFARADVKTYLLQDVFASPVAAGNLNNTSAEPGPGTRTVTDTENKLSIAGGALTFAGGKASPAWGDPGVWYPAISRAVGRTLINTVVSPPSALIVRLLACDANTSGDANNATIGVAAQSFYTFWGADSATNFVATHVYTYGATYQLAIVLRAAGAYYFARGGALATWTLLWHIIGDSTATLYPCVVNYNAVFTADNIRIPDRLYIPTPLAYDTFGRADGSLGSSEAVGPDGQQTPQLAWTGATWAIVSGVAVNTPTVGAELWDSPAAAFTSGTYAWTKYGTNVIANDGNELKVTFGDTSLGAYEYLSDAADLSANLVVGRWYAFSCKNRVSVGASAGISIVCGSITNLPAQTSTVLATQGVIFRANSTTGDYIRCYGLDAGESIWLDDLALLPLSLATLFATHVYSTVNVMADATLAAYTTGTQAGMVLRLDSAASPANFIIAYQDSGNVKIDECVAGVYTNLGTYASAYAASDSIRVSLDGNAWRLYKITSAGAATLLGAGSTAIISGNLHGLFSTDSGNTFSNFQVWARGNENQYNQLDAM